MTGQAGVIVLGCACNSNTERCSGGTYGFTCARKRTGTQSSVNGSKGGQGWSSGQCTETVCKNEIFNQSFGNTGTLIEDASELVNMMIYVDHQGWCGCTCSGITNGTYYKYVRKEYINGSGTGGRNGTCKCYYTKYTVSYY